LKVAPREQKKGERVGKKQPRESESSFGRSGRKRNRQRGERESDTTQSLRILQRRKQEKGLGKDKSKE